MEEMMKEMQRKNQEAAKTDEPAFRAEMKKLYPTATFTASGLAYIIEKQGTGERAKAGNTVSVHYHGAFTNGSKFDASYDRNEPITFQLGQGMVIPGWEEGIALLNKGAKAKLIIPYWLAYGVDGRAPVIPAKSTLIFDTEMVDIK
jgi:FKBP-type peptidyl-prolyl cis-trans isomerase